VRVDARLQFERLERLGHVVVGAGLEGGHLLAQRILGGNDDDRDQGRWRM
jgi:hypothetical protein